MADERLAEGDVVLFLFSPGLADSYFFPQTLGERYGGWWEEIRERKSARENDVLTIRQKKLCVDNQRLKEIVCAFGKSNNINFWPNGTASFSSS